MTAPGCDCGCAEPEHMVLGCRCPCHDAVPVADEGPPVCDECGGGPDVTKHDCWCEEGHLALRDEVRRLRDIVGSE